MIINHSCYFCQKIKEAAVLQVLKFNKQSGHFDGFFSYTCSKDIPGLVLH